jgi:hypothetical protein
MSDKNDAELSEAEYYAVVEKARALLFKEGILTNENDGDFELLNPNEVSIADARDLLLKEDILTDFIRAGVKTYIRVTGLRITQKLIPRIATQTNPQDDKFIVARVAEEMIIDGQKLIALAARLQKGDLAEVQGELNQVSGRLIEEWEALADISDKRWFSKNGTRTTKKLIALHGSPES